MPGSDWCAFMKDKENPWDVSMQASLGTAVLRDGQRRTAWPCAWRATTPQGR